MRRARAGAVAAILILAGCAAGSGIVPVGPDADTYTVSEMRAPVLGGGQEALRVALLESSAFCRAQGRVAVPVLITPDGDPYTPYFPTAFDATFRCAVPGDPAVARSPTPPRAPALAPSPS